MGESMSQRLGSSIRIVDSVPAGLPICFPRPTGCKESNPNGMNCSQKATYLHNGHSTRLWHLPWLHQNRCNNVHLPAVRSGNVSGTTRCLGKVTWLFLPLKPTSIKINNVFISHPLDRGSFVRERLSPTTHPYTPKEPDESNQTP